MNKESVLFCILWQWKHTQKRYEDIIISLDRKEMLVLWDKMGAGQKCKAGIYSAILASFLVVWRITEVTDFVGRWHQYIELLR